MVTLTQLKLLIGLQEFGTVRSAAEAMNFSASAVSAQLAQLERGVGVTLFERAGRKIRLSQAGEVLVTHAREILDHLDHAQQEIRDLDTEPKGTVRIAALTSFMQNLLPDVMARLKTDWPGVELQLVECEPDDAMRMVRRGESDIAISSDHPQDPSAGPDGLIRVNLFRDEIVVCMSSQAAARYPHPELSLSALQHESWILDSGQMSALMAEMSRDWPVTPTFVGDMTSYQLALSYVQSGLAMTLQPELATRGFGDVATRYITPRQYRTVYMCVKPSRTRRAVTVVMDTIVTTSRLYAADRAEGAA